MIKVVIIGYGNVGVHIAQAFEQNEGIDLIQVYSRNKKTLASCPLHFATTCLLTTLKEADVYIVAVPDNAIETISKALPFKNKLIAHTSGSVALKTMDSKNRRGVWYPLQTFSKAKSVSFSKIPICVEAENEEDQMVLKTLGTLVSTSVQLITSEQRASIHLAAVFANNFSNHMYHIASQILEKKGVDFSILRPLIKETAHKINTLAPSEAQTGPAMREDSNTIKNHLELLEQEDHKKLYTFITQSIKHNTSQ